VGEIVAVWVKGEPKEGWKIKHTLQWRLVEITKKLGSGLMYEVKDKKDTKLKRHVSQMAPHPPQMNVNLHSALPHQQQQDDAQWKTADLGHDPSDRDHLDVEQMWAVNEGNDHFRLIKVLQVEGDKKMGLVKGRIWVTETKGKGKWAEACALKLSQKLVKGKAVPDWRCKTWEEWFTAQELIARVLMQEEKLSSNTVRYLYEHAKRSHVQDNLSREDKAVQSTPKLEKAINRAVRARERGRARSLQQLRQRKQ
jgi:hypothetical protein